MADNSDKLFKSLETKGSITEKEFKYFSTEFKKATNLCKLYLLLKIHKRLENVPGRPVISNCGTPAEKVSEFLDSQLKPVMKSPVSLKRLRRFRRLRILVLFLRIPSWLRQMLWGYHEAGLKTLEKALNNGTNKKFSTKDLVKMAKFVLKNNYVEFNGKVKQQISGTAIGTKLAPPYAWVFMD